MAAPEGKIDIGCAVGMVDCGGVGLVHARYRSSIDVFLARVCSVDSRVPRIVGAGDGNIEFTTMCIQQQQYRERRLRRQQQWFGVTRTAGMYLGSLDTPLFPSSA